MTNDVLLIDGNNLLHRAYHAAAAWNKVNPTGLPGFKGLMLDALKAFRPRWCAVAFDTDSPTFRHAIYPAYKATRPPKPPGLAADLRNAELAAAEIGLSPVSAIGFEADDILCTSAKAATSHGLKVTIITNDSDALQLVTRAVRVIAPAKGLARTTTYDERAVTAKYGLAPWQLVAYKAMTGDPSDNISGVPGIGPVKATSLLQTYGSLDEILRPIGSTARDPRARKVQQHEHTARLNESIITLSDNAPVVLLES